MSFTHRLALSGVALTTVGALTGCSSGTGAHPPAIGARTTAATTTATATRASTASSTAPGSARESGPKWVISMPETMAGYPRVTPTGDQLKLINQFWKETTGQLQVTGQSVVGVYDDAQEDAYLIVTGLNGNGFDTTNLRMLPTLPQPTSDTAGNPMAVDFQRVAPGPHGGDDLCEQTSTTVHTDTSFFGPVTTVAENTSCLWMTGTTLGAVSFYNKLDGKYTGTGGNITPAVAGPIMVTVRNEVEHLQG